VSATPLPASPFRDEDRPRAPVHPSAVTTAAGRHGQAALVGIHAHLRSEMAQVVRAVRAASTDARRAADVRALVNDLSMGVNYRELGSFCGRYCSVVDLHHRIEDAALFVDLGAADPELRPVLERLSAEHVVVHDALVELDRALVEMLTAEAAALPRVQDAVERLSAGLLDHLAYEEAELLPALGRLGVPV
jgi:hemerythrin-like domain-containing protein